jgi:hypothetical protein
VRAWGNAGIAAGLRCKCKGQTFSGEENTDCGFFSFCTSCKNHVHANADISLTTSLTDIKAGQSMDVTVSAAGSINLDFKIASVKLEMDVPNIVNARDVYGPF